MKRIILSLMIGVMITAFTAGCSQNDNSGSDTINNGITAESAASEQLIEPGQLISKTEAEELLGKALKDAEKNDNAVVGQKICFYDSLNEEAEGFLEVSLTQQAFMQKTEITPKSIFESIRENFADELTQVDGIGDEAFIATPGIHILKGDYYIVIGVGNSSDEDNRAILKTSGIRAVENLELLINK